MNRALRLTLKTLGVAVVVLLLTLAWALWKPMAASKVAWKLLEDQQLRSGFIGITTDGNVEADLFPIRSTGVSTAPVVEAAQAFIASLSEDMKARALFPVDDSEWRRWANVHLATRQGVGLLDFNAAQEAAAMNLLRTSLSARGFATAMDIIKLEGHLADLLNNYMEYGEKRYWFTIMGEPSLTEPWGWQIDGHHLVINYFVMGEQVVMTPTFMGSEPVSTDSSRFGPLSVLDEELEQGLALINALDQAQRAEAIIDPEKTGNNNHGELFSDNAVVPYEGLTLDKLNAEQAEMARALIALYIHQQRDDLAAVKMAEIEAHWDRTHFAWVGGTGSEDVFYYRIHSPVVMIEYDHQSPIALDGPQRPTRRHAHTVVRTPNGNDYGKDLLRQHLASQVHQG